MVIVIAEGKDKGEESGNRCRLSLESAAVALRNTCSRTLAGLRTYEWDFGFLNLSSPAEGLPTLKQCSGAVALPVLNYRCGGSAGIIKVGNFFLPTVMHRLPVSFRGAGNPLEHQSRAGL